MRIGLTLGTGRKTDSGLAVLTVADDGSVVTGGSGQRSSVSNLLLDVADNGTFGALGDGEDVSDVQGSLLSAVDERSGGDSLGGDEGLLSELVSVRVSEDDGGEGSSSVLSVLSGEWREGGGREGVEGGQKMAGREKV